MTVIEELSCSKRNGAYPHGLSHEKTLIARKETIAFNLRNQPPPGPLRQRTNSCTRGKRFGY